MSAPADIIIGAVAIVVAIEFLKDKPKGKGKQ